MDEGKIQYAQINESDLKIIFSFLEFRIAKKINHLFHDTDNQHSINVVIFNIDTQANQNIDKSDKKYTHVYINLQLYETAIKIIPVIEIAHNRKCILRNSEK